MKTDDGGITADDSLGGEWRPGEGEGPPLCLTCAEASPGQTHTTGRKAVLVYLPGRKTKYVSKVDFFNIR